jgi:hypothetical protein
MTLSLTQVFCYFSIFLHILDGLRFGEYIVRKLDSCLDADQQYTVVIDAGILIIHL